MYSTLYASYVIIQVITAHTRARAAAGGRIDPKTETADRIGSTISEAGQSILKNVLFFEICSPDRRARYTRTQANSTEKDTCDHFGPVKPCGILLLGHKDVENHGLLKGHEGSGCFLTPHPEPHTILKNVSKVNVRLPACL